MKKQQQSIRAVDTLQLEKQGGRGLAAAAAAAAAAASMLKSNNTAKGISQSADMYTGA